MIDFTHRVAFAIGTGRCGTHFIAKVLDHEPGVASSHERYPMAEAMERYRCWYDLPIDPEGFLHLMQQGIEQDLAAHRVSFESSAYLSLSVQTLHTKFGARFVLMVRQPDQVVNSLWGKGWYSAPYIQGNPDLALGYQEGTLPHQSLSRIAPRGAELEAWQRLTRIGRLSWFWSALNQAALAQLERLPETAWRIVRLEDLDHDRYRELCAFIGIEPTLTPAQYDDIVGSKPGRRRRVRGVSDWTDQECAEFEQQVGKLCERLGYTSSTQALRVAEAEKQRVTDQDPEDARQGSLWARLRGLFKGAGPGGSG